MSSFTLHAARPIPGSDDHIKCGPIIVSPNITFLLNTLTLNFFKPEQQKHTLTQGQKSTVKIEQN